MCKDTLKQAIQEYLDVRTANAYDLDVRQVKLLNRLEENCTILKVTKDGNRIHVEVEDEDGYYYEGTILETGSVTWR